MVRGAALPDCEGLAHGAAVIGISIFPADTGAEGRAITGGSGRAVPDGGFRVVPRGGTRGVPPVAHGAFIAVISGGPDDDDDGFGSAVIGLVR